MAGLKQYNGVDMCMYCATWNAGPSWECQQERTKIYPEGEGCPWHVEWKCDQMTLDCARVIRDRIGVYKDPAFLNLSSSMGVLFRTDNVVKVESLEFVKNFITSITRIYKITDNIITITEGPIFKRKGDSNA